jgi:hypothetical protein
LNGGNTYKFSIQFTRGVNVGKYVSAAWTKVIDKPTFSGLKFTSTGKLIGNDIYPHGFVYNTSDKTFSNNLDFTFNNKGT